MRLIPFLGGRYREIGRKVFRPDQRVSAGAIPLGPDRRLRKRRRSYLRLGLGACLALRLLQGSPRPASGIEDRARERLQGQGDTFGGRDLGVIRYGWVGGGAGLCMVVCMCPLFVTPPPLAHPTWVMSPVAASNACAVPPPTARAPPPVRIPALVRLARVRAWERRKVVRLSVAAFVDPASDDPELAPSSPWAKVCPPAELVWVRTPTVRPVARFGGTGPGRSGLGTLVGVGKEEVGGGATTVMGSSVEKEG